jgi:hypothetical protein
LEIFGACFFESPDRTDPFGESKPASVEDRLSGVEASMLGCYSDAVGDAPGFRGKRFGGEAEEKVDFPYWPRWVFNQVFFITSLQLHIGRTVFSSFQFHIKIALSSLFQIPVQLIYF